MISKFFVDFSELSKNEKVSAIRTLLLSNKTIDILSGLNLVDSETCEDLKQEIIDCSYNYKTEVRVAAYKALEFMDPYQISSVIADGLRDIDLEVVKAASRVFHGNKIDMIN